MKLFLISAVVCLVVSALAGLFYLATGGLSHADTPHLPGVIAGVLACVSGGMAVFLGAVAAVVAILDRVHPAQNLRSGNPNNHDTSRG